MTYGEGPPSPYIEARTPGRSATWTSRIRGGVPPPPTLKRRVVGQFRPHLRDTGRVPPPPTLKHETPADEWLTAEIRGGSPLPLH